MSDLPTVRIHRPHASGDWATINESDFDPAQHVLFDSLPVPVPGAVEPIQEDQVPIPVKRRRGRPRKSEG